MPRREASLEPWVLANPIWFNVSSNCFVSCTISFNLFSSPSDKSLISLSFNKIAAFCSNSSLFNCNCASFSEVISPVTEAASFESSNCFVAISIFFSYLS